MLNRSFAAAAGLLLAASMFAPAYAGTQLANAANSAFCNDEAARASYMRKGGFCDQLDDMNSLVKDDGDDGCKVTMNVPSAASRLLLAAMYDPCDPCYDYGLVNDLLPPGATDRVRVADGCLPPP